jgi:hypothetical protein
MTQKWYMRVHILTIAKSFTIMIISKLFIQYVFSYIFCHNIIDKPTYLDITKYVIGKKLHNERLEFSIWNWFLLTKNSPLLLDWIF